MSATNAQQIANFAAFLEEFGENAAAGIQAALDKGADQMVQAAQAVCPDNDLDHDPGQLRDSIHKHPGGRPLSVIVEADAKDAKGDFYGLHVEVGHRTKDGGHVPAHPFFYPAARLVKATVKKDIAQAVRVAAKKNASGL